VQNLSKSIELKPNDTDSFIARARAYVALEVYEQALRDVNHVMAVSPEGRRDVHSQRRTFMPREKNITYAIEDFSLAIDLRKRFAIAHSSIVDKRNDDHWGKNKWLGRFQPGP